MSMFKSVLAMGLVLGAVALVANLGGSARQLSQADMVAVVGGGDIDVTVGARCENNEACQVDVAAKLIWNQDWYTKVTGTFTDGGDVSVKCGTYFRQDRFKLECGWDHDKWTVSASVTFRF